MKLFPVQRGGPLYQYEISSKTDRSPQFKHIQKKEKGQSSSVIFREHHVVQHVTY